ncbi:MAG: type II secretion system F family protein [Bryobacteraceae bacterium]|nr:type II secretion system F family protein [Bryobacteraceae bacterium]
MPLLVSAFIFAGVAIAVSILGLRLWVRPKQAMDRVAGVGVASPADAAPVHPSLVFRDVVKRLGEMVPTSPKDAGKVQKRLIRAGIRSSSALKTFYGMKVALAGVLPVIGFLVTSSESENRMLILLACLGAGFLAPNKYVDMRAKRRQKQIRRALPNALDLLVVCVESGLGLDQAILQVAKELEHAHPEISEEFGLVNLELKAGNRRADALRNLAERTAVEDLKKLVAVLIQADRFGTGVSQSLRGHADYMRIQARQVAEEKAAKLGVKLLFPIFFCVLPSLFVVTVGPMAVKIVRELIPMMNNI